MSSAKELLHELREQRMLFIKGLDANKDDINLDIFEDFYPDKAHFVYELLQNAEDAGATAISFSLTADKLICEHDGRRTFTEADVRSITGIHNSTKTKAPDKIGKFGVGFKSVFVYTQSPTVRSGNFSFRIERLILPEWIEPDESLGNRTRFEFPFDHTKKSRESAYAEVAAGLEELDETSLLFLSSLQSIAWSTDAGATGEVNRQLHSSFHYEIRKRRADETIASFHFLKFEQPVPGLENQRVAIAFPLGHFPGIHQYDEANALSTQMRIVPAAPGRVAVFFTAAKESSGLRFHLHAPFVPELSRASIKETPANDSLFEQLAQLASESLHHVKTLGLLTPDFLAVLPNPQDQLPPRYSGIRDKIITEMNERDLTPTYDRGHAPARRLLQARATLKELLSTDDLNYVGEFGDELPMWAIGVQQRSSRIDQFLAGLELREWGLEQFVATLRRKASEEEMFGGLDDSFLEWLAGKTPEWFQRLYALLHSELGDASYRFKKMRIVRLRDGTLSIAEKTYFPSENATDDVSIADVAAYTSGKSEQQQRSAREFLVKIGVRELLEAEEIELILQRRYTKEAPLPEAKTHIRDLKRFVALVEKQPDRSSLFGSYFVFQGDNGRWYKPSGIYLDKPYLDTDLSAYYSRFADSAERRALHTRYAQSGISRERLSKFAQDVGVGTTLVIETRDCGANPERRYLYSAEGVWSYYSKNEDYYVPNLAEFLKTPSLALSRLIWRALSALPAYPDYMQATFQRNRSHGPHYAASLLVHELRDATWVPQADGKFSRPADASAELLPHGFPYDPGYRWLKAVRFGETVSRHSAEARRKDDAAKSLGFHDAAEIEAAKRIKTAFDALSPSEQQRILGAAERRNQGAIPDREPANPQRRAENVRDSAMNAPNKVSETRERSVSIGREDVKDEAGRYLLEHYRNADGEMTCQICKAPLPFKLDDGREFFETVEFLPELTKRHYQNYLALCPNHSAMYQHANGSKEVLRAAFEKCSGSEVPLVLAQRDATIYFSRVHIIDLRAVLEAERALLPNLELPSQPSVAPGPVTVV